jgi:hypothetical protein
MKDIQPRAELAPHTLISLRVCFIAPYKKSLSETRVQARHLQAFGVSHNPLIPGTGQMLSDRFRGSVIR